MNKSLKIMITILVLLLIMWGIIFLVDYNRVSNFKEPIFVRKSEMANDGGSYIGYGLGYRVEVKKCITVENGIETEKIEMYIFNKVVAGAIAEIKVTDQNMNDINPKKYVELENLELDYDFAQMVEDRCYILTNSNAVYHLEELDNFIKNVENKNADEIRIIEYTIEGQPVITNLEYTGDKFILKNDWRRDAWAVEEDRKIVTTEYDASKYVLVKSETSSDITNLKTYDELSLHSIESDETVHICTYAEVKQDENEKFKIQFNKNLNGDEIIKILGREETDRYDYDIYSYKGTVNIIVNGEEMSLREALLNNKITAEEILEKAKKDANGDKTIIGDIYRDGGSTVYIYNDYSILKLNTLSGDGNYGKKDLYIGVPSMNINDILATYNS